MDALGKGVVKHSESRQSARQTTGVRRAIGTSRVAVCLTTDKSDSENIETQRNTLRPTLGGAAGLQLFM